MENIKDKSIQKSFFEISKLNYSEFLYHLPNKKNIVLDFGCGNGIFRRKFSSKKIKLIKMYDKNKKLKSLIEKKYKKNLNIKWTSSIFTNYNVVFINSTIQYLTLKNYKSLINHFFRKKVDMIIISDIPKYPYYTEALICVFTNFKRILSAFKYLFQKNYNFYNYKNMEELIVENFNYQHEFCKNINEDKFIRYSLIFRRNVYKK